MSQSPHDERILQGIPASPGVAEGPAFVFFQRELEIPMYEVTPPRVEKELERFEEALLEARRQITKVRHDIQNRLGEDEARIFDAHLMVLEDQALIQEVYEEVRESKLNIEHCFRNVVDRFIGAFSALEDEYLRERVKDIDDVAKRVLSILTGQSTANLLELVNKRVIVAEDITPSDAATLDRAKILALVTDTGSRTSHAVIMARSLGVPAVVGLHDATERVHNEDTVLVDGYDGTVVINPSEKTLFQYGRLRDKRRSIEEELQKTAQLPACTTDGRELAVEANIAGPDECEAADRYGAGGVGLFRTEGLFMRIDGFPGEEEQFRAYQTVAQRLAPRKVVIRTLDLGGDKQAGNYYFAEEERNPFMGFRAIRFCLEHVDVFKQQLRAILRASAEGNVEIMYPMISHETELIEANEILAECKRELRAANVPFDENVPVGAMIEVPAAAVIADRLASHCSFFSIGTNDLIQYLLAVDRVNDRIAHLYEPAHPAVLRTINDIIRAGHTHGIPVSICGEMGGDPRYVPLLFGMGAAKISASPPALPEIKFLLRKISFKDCTELAEEISSLNCPIRITERLTKFYSENMGDYSMIA